MARPTKKELWKQAISRKVTKLTPEVVQKLKEAFAIGATVMEACYYAEISVSTYYNWVNKNPKLLEEFELMRKRLPLKAKQVIASAIENGNSIADSWKLLERTNPESYGETIKLKHDGQISNLPGNEVPPEDKAVIDEFHKKMRENRLKRSREKAVADGELKPEQKES